MAVDFTTFTVGLFKGIETNKKIALASLGFALTGVADYFLAYSNPIHELSGVTYVALEPLEDNENGEYVILRLDYDAENDEELLVTIDDDDEFDAVADVFDDMFFNDLPDNQ